MTNTITLPWPPKELNPNQLRRLHWSVRSKKAKEYRESCYWLTKKAQIKLVERPLLVVEFYPPSKRRLDADNCLSACKAGIDGMAQAMGIDDSLFKNYHIKMMDEVGGYVKVTLGECDEIN